MPKINRESPSQQIASRLRRAIAAGELKAGDKAPTTRELMADYGVAAATAHRVLKTLQAEGYLVARPGRSGGSFVTSEQERSRIAAQQTEALRADHVPLGDQAKVIEAGTADASEEIAAELGVKVGDPVIYRRRIHLDAEGDPVARSTSWLPGDLAESVPQLLTSESIIGDTSSLVNASGGEEKQQAVAASVSVAEALQLEEGAPVIVGRTWFQDDAGRVLEYREIYSVGWLEARWGSAARK
ncbi:GntR family transcriptional regulator [Nocardioides sp. NPDC059952]|uniref:GntR family transcriptional regulator n=1 Tax=Nocardioides sp. NPDC059952 TaxID=3347014 RepID=UPI00365F599C